MNNSPNGAVLTEEAVAFNCPNCGAELKFNADKQRLCCEFCESEFTQQEIASTNAAQSAQQQLHNAGLFCDQLNEYYCPNCGAEIACDDSTAADICVYCHSPVVLRGKLSGQMMPDRIIPFKFSKEEAENKFTAFAKKHFFVPREFKSKKQASLISGVYYPFWVTDADTDGEYYAKATKVRSWRIGNVQYTETSRFNIIRRGFIHFEDIVTSAIKEEDKAMLEGILPYPSESLQPFSMPYLSGFKAKKRNLERDALSPEVKARMNEYAATLLKRTVHGYATVNETGRNVRIRQSHWEYSLMPVWVLNYVTKKKTYKYAMNGYTGKIYGELPVSFGKLLAVCGAVFAAVTPIVALIGGMFL